MAYQAGLSTYASVFNALEKILFRVRRGIEDGEISDVESIRNELDRLNCSVEELWWSCENFDSWKNSLNRMLSALEVTEDALDEYDLQKSQLPLGYLRRFRNLKGNQDLVSFLIKAKVNLVHPGYIIIPDPKTAMVRSFDHMLQFHPCGKKLSEIAASNEELINDHLLGGNSSRSAVVFLGEGGIGKTTLAMKIFDQVKSNFNFTFWIAVSNYENEGELVKYMANRILTMTGYEYWDQINTMTDKELIVVVRKTLMSRRYLIVFDDVWTEDFVHVMRDMFPDENTGSRMIVTTRKDAIAASCKEALSSHVHRVDPLSEATSLRLFYRKVFQYECEGQCPPELEYLSVKIVRMCGGLPLAIISVADFLSKKEKVAVEWRRLVENFSLEIQSNHVLDVLGLSFLDLPHHLKPCFLYFSLFPKESLILNDKLFQIWIAEGLVREGNGKTLEQVCKEYLNELIGRNLVQACEGFYGVEKVCRLSSFMNEMAMQKAKQSNFFRIWDGREWRFKVRSRRVLICTEDVQNYLEGIEESQVLSGVPNYLEGIEESQLCLLVRNHLEGIKESRVRSILQNYYMGIYSENIEESHVRSILRTYYEGIYLEGIEESQVRSIVRNYYEDIEASQVRSIVRNYCEEIEASQVRSILQSNTGAINDSILVILFKKYKFLTLLDVENSPLESLPNEVGNLVFMKYLSLKNTKVKQLPKSIGKLVKLQTLDVSGTLLVELPMVIFKLKNLRHLLATFCDIQTSLNSARGVKVKEGIGSLLNLQTLMTVDASLSGMDVIQELKKLVQLRSLSVSRLSEELGNALCSRIEQLSHLESLRLRSPRNHDLNVQSVSSPPPQLERLVLNGALKGFPEWISHLQNLVMLCLSLSSLADTPFRHLSKLPNLECLWLYRAYEGTQIHFNDGDFLRLKLLVLREMQGLESIEIDYGAMPLLEEFRIGPSPSLKDGPAGIVHLKNLKVVSFYDMPNEFVLKLQPRGGSEYWKVENVPSVLFLYRDNENRYISYKLGESDLLSRLEGLDTSVNDLNRRDHRVSFSFTDDEEDNASTSSFRLDHIARSNASSDRFTFFTDDVEQ